MTRRALALSVVLAAACGDLERVRPVLQVPEGDEAPAYGTVPFPTDALRGPGGTLEIIPGLRTIARNHADVLARHLATLDGFGLRPTVEFFLDGPLDAASLPAVSDAADAPAVVIDVDPSSPQWGRIVPYEWRYDPVRAVIAGAPVPGVVLREGTRYAAVVTDALLDDDGIPLGRSDGLSRLAAGADVPDRWRTTSVALAALEGEPPWRSGARIAGITVFTTQRASRTLLAARELLNDADAVPLPTLAFPEAELIFDSPERLDALLGAPERFAEGPRAGQERWGWSNSTGLAHESVGVVASGTMTLARFRREGQEGDEPSDRTFVVDADTAAPAVVAPAEPIPITFILPAAPAPPAGYPVAIFGHGLGASRHAALTFAEPLARAGFAVVAIDFHGHGSRWRDQDRRNNLAGILDDFRGEGDLSDGFGDTTGNVTLLDFFENLLNFSAVRDSIRQSALDLSQLVRLLRRADLDLDPLAAPYGEPPRLDTRRMAYLGESYGTVVGTLFAAIEPDVDLFVLDTPGAGIIDLAVMGSPEIGSITLPLAMLVYRPTGTIDRFHPLVALVQAILDPADPLTYAPHILRDRFTVGRQELGERHVVAIEVVGDEVIPNEASRALARALELEVLAPHLSPPGLPEVASPASGNVNGQTAVMVQYAPATHGANWTSEIGVVRFEPGFPHEGDDPFPRLPEPVEIENPIYETLDQVVDILHTHQQGAAPTVRSTLPPTPWP
jgi:pimeloyl-ACP methyl ester carboxylesterase